MAALCKDFFHFLSIALGSINIIIFGLHQSKAELGKNVAYRNLEKKEIRCNTVPRNGCVCRKFLCSPLRPGVKLFHLCQQHSFNMTSFPHSSFSSGSAEPLLFNDSYTAMPTTTRLSLVYILMILSAGLSAASCFISLQHDDLDAGSGLGHRRPQSGCRPGNQSESELRTRSQRPRRSRPHCKFGGWPWFFGLFIAFAALFKITIWPSYPSLAWANPLLIDS